MVITGLAKVFRWLPPCFFAWITGCISTRAVAQLRTNRCRCMPSPGGICCHLPPLAAALRGDVDEVARGHMPQRPNASRSWNRRTLGSSRRLLRRSSVYSLRQSSTRPCCSRRPGAALGACCALRRTLLCDGKLLSPERRCAAKRTSRCDELSWFCRIDFELPSAVPAVWSAKNRTTQRRPAPVAARCQLYRRRSS